MDAPKRREPGFIFWKINLRNAQTFIKKSVVRAGPARGPLHTFPSTMARDSIYRSAVSMAAGCGRLSATVFLKNRVGSLYFGGREINGGRGGPIEFGNRCPLMLNIDLTTLPVTRCRAYRAQPDPWLWSPGVDLQNELLDS